MDGAQQRDVRTVFVRNISFDVNEAQLQEVFGDIGPVRSCFLVRPKDATRHKGFGFVQFAIPEDAERAVQELQSHELQGRKLKLESAVKRAPLEERKKKRKHDDTLGASAAPITTAHTNADDVDGHADAEEEAAAASSPKRQRPAPTPHAAAAGAAVALGKHKLLRAVALGGLTPDTVEGAVKLARAAGGVAEVLSPAPQGDVQRAHLAADGCTGIVVFVIYASVKEAMDAVPKLHGKMLQPAQQHGKRGKKGKQQAAAVDDGDQQPAVKLWARAVTGEGAYVKKWRIILRNLPFKVTEGELRTLLDPAGFVWDIHIPAGPDGRIKGFAFASFTCHPHAQRAIEIANGQTLRKRLVAADWAVGKGAFEKVKEAAAGTDGGRDGEAGSGSDDGTDGEGGSEDGDEGEEWSDDDGVDGGLHGGSSDEDMKDDAEGEEGAEEGGEGDPAAAKEQEMLHNVLDKLLSKEERQQQKEERKQPAQPQQQQEQQKQQGKQEAKAADAAGAKQAAAGAATAAQPAGVRGADGAPSTSAPAPFGERSNTVFVRGLPLDVTSQELQARFERFGPIKAARLVLDKDTGKVRGTAFVEFKSTETAAAAAHACKRARDGKGPDVMVKGRSVEVDLALSKDGARTLAAERAGASGVAKDKRNLYLAKEGAIEEGSAAWAGMSEQDKNKRKRAAEEKKLKLKSPNFCVSTLRLNVRNIPPAWDERRLKELFVEAVKERATKERPRVRQVKILHDPERLDADGAPRSKGIGFIEFDDHSHALAALRQLNNNPRPFGKDRRPIVEFAIENAKVLKMRQDKLSKQRERQERRRQQRQQGGQEGEEEGEEGQQEDGAGEQAAAGQSVKGKKKGRDAASTGAGADGDGENGEAGPSREAGGHGGGDGGDGEQKKSRWALRKERRRQQAEERQQKEQQEQRQQQANGAGARGSAAAAGAPAGNGRAAGGRKGTRGGSKGGESWGKAAPTSSPAAVEGAAGPGSAAGAQQPAAKAGAAKAGATRPVPNQKRQQQRLRQQQQQQQEQQREQGHQQRKRQADDAIDVLASAPGSSNTANAGKRHKKGDKGELKLDALIEDYKSRLFGAAKPAKAAKGTGSGKGGGVKAGAAAKGPQEGAGAAIKRWFE